MLSTIPPVTAESLKALAAVLVRLRYPLANLNGEAVAIQITLTDIPPHQMQEVRNVYGEKAVDFEWWTVTWFRFIVTIARLADAKATMWVTFVYPVQ